MRVKVKQWNYEGENGNLDVFIEAFQNELDKMKEVKNIKVILLRKKIDIGLVSEENKIDFTKHFTTVAY